MDVFASGWRRYCGTHNLVQTDFSNETFGIRPKSLAWQKPYFYKDEILDHYIFAVSAERLRLNGDFFLQVALTTPEIINLAKVALADQKFSEALKLLAR